MKREDGIEEKAADLNTQLPKAPVNIYNESEQNLPANACSVVNEAWCLPPQVAYFFDRDAPPSTVRRGA